MKHAEFWENKELLGDTRFESLTSDIVMSSISF